jgi:hypothetical protein
MAREKEKGLTKGRENVMAREKDGPLAEGRPMTSYNGKKRERTRWLGKEKGSSTCNRWDWKFELEEPLQPKALTTNGNL